MKYYLQRMTFRSCDQVCESHGLLCTAKDHGFEEEKVLGIFQQLLGKKCTTGFNDTDEWNELGPSYANHPKGHELRGRCLAWKDIPKQINCKAKPLNPYVQRLCPCINGTKCLQYYSFSFFWGFEQGDLKRVGKRLGFRRTGSNLSWNILKENSSQKQFRLK